MIIAVSGKKRSGKDTIAKIIQCLIIEKDDPDFFLVPISNEMDSNTFNFRMTTGIASYLQHFDTSGINEVKSNFTIKHYADKLKQIASILLGIPVEDFNKEEVKDSYLGPEWDKWYVETFGLIKAFEPHGWERQNAGPIYYENPFSTEKEVRDWWEDKVKNGNHPLGNPYLGVVRYVVEHMTVRQFLQRLGTDALRDKVHPNIHINALFADYKQNVSKQTTSKNEYSNGKPLNYINLYPNWVIADVRFPNEIDPILDRKGEVLRVIRTSTQTSDSHPSETALDNYEFNYTIYNDGTLEDLVNNVRKYLQFINVL